MSRYLDAEPIGSHIIWKKALFAVKEVREPSKGNPQGRTILDFSRLSSSINSKKEMALAILVVLPGVAGKVVRDVGRRILSFG